MKTYILRFFFAFSLLGLLPGCPNPFPDCPPTPTLDYFALDANLIGGWHGEASYWDTGFVKIYTVGLALNADRTFELTIHDNSGRYAANGIWAVDALASPQPRIQLGVACSDSERHPESSWHRGVYDIQSGVFGEYLTIDTLKYPESAVIESDFNGIVWRLERDEPGGN